MMRQRLWSILILVCLGTVSGQLWAKGTLAERFDAANKAFENGSYEDAAAAYGALEKMGVDSVTLYYNRGCAEARLGHLGRAIQYYEKVLVRAPFHEDATYNMATIRDYIARRANRAGRDASLAPAIGPWRAVLNRFSPNQAAFLFLVFYVGAFLVLFARRWVNKEMWRLGSGVVLGVLAVLAVMLGGVTVGKTWQLAHHQEAVVVVDDHVDDLVKEGPGSMVTRFGLEEGSRVEVLEKRRGWWKIKDDHGRNGWVRQKYIGTI